MKKLKSILASAMLVATIAAPANAAGLLTFIIDGDTFSQPFRITNNSTAGEKVVGFGFNLNPVPYVFDTVSGGVPNTSAGVPFGAVGGSGVLTGLVGSPVVPDGAKFFQIAFNDFDVGETFQFDIDVDPSGVGSATVFGNQLIGASIFADFSNGLRGSGFLEAVPGNSDAAQFVIRTVTVTPPAVPEPATWAMMLFGFGVIGRALRARGRRAVASMA